ncbi:hypothetical protein ACFPZ0_26640 [Streptomonospora nanhaiensis]|uniref:Uncharacterized protein n=1 Tax=Streptomonospora nanhaiensis TaxID=1323731 RepID=A0A853BRT2_9ACTN|nr:hypothetical protein [Streptomonospora nanhaiensis]MBV2365164.1 hypothetical protein [Streptomonospora nanhaiensis]MBV2366331.1 hypothetical protein [Streptomonospora nanhaiensis]MBX9391722.1 hypothetical protein [Streptomonospora nanhaiensis]NYI97435.1 hypothetical protein [Streptomonospora nanhaiensis]
MATTDRPGPARAEHPAGDPAPPRRGRARPRWLRRLGTRGRLRLLTVLCLSLVAALFAATYVALERARDGLDVIGEGEGRKVVETANLYFALSDMDAQMANVLLLGGDHDLGTGRDAALERYDERRATANRALLHAAQLAEGDRVEEETVWAVMDGMNRYERLVAEARLLNDADDDPAGPPSDEVIALYRKAAELMRRDLLPKAYNLTLESGATVRSTYEANSAAATAGIGLVAAAAAALLAALVVLQVFLRRRFRRRYNAWLGLATAGVLVMGLASVAMLQRQSVLLRTAKEEGLESVLALSRARAISTGMNADQSRWLMDPDNAATYEQNFLEDAQTVVFLVPEDGDIPGNLHGYTTEVTAAVPRHDDYPGRMLGLLGEEVATGGGEGETRALRRTLRTYAAFLRADERMRAIAREGDTAAAVDAHITGPDSVEAVFADYEEALIDLTRLHMSTFDTSVATARDDLAGWNHAVVAACGAFALLIALGVRPRLAEYR